MFDDAGLDLDAWNQPHSRFSNDRLDRVWLRAIELTGDPCIGLDAARFVSPASLHALGFAWLVSDTLYDALSRLVRYADLIGGEPQLELALSRDTCRLTIVRTKISGAAAAQRMDSFWAGLIGLSRQITSDRLVPLSLTLRRPAPPCVADFYALFQAPVTFAAGKDSIVFSRDVVETTLPTANRVLAHTSDQVIDDYLAKVAANTFADRVRTRLIDLLPGGAFAEKDIAASLHVSTRTLQRRLADEGTGFKVLLDEARRELALRLIGERRLSIQETSYLLGFSEPGNFSRAFRRWTGEAPSVYRESKEAEAVGAG